MIKIAAVRITAGVVVICALAPAMAHHSVTAQFDVNKTVEVEGVLTKVEWINPHGYFVFDVTGADGKVTRWSIETPPPNAWRRLGVASKGYIPIGASYKLQFCPARDGSNSGLLTVMNFPDGRSINILGAQQISGGN